MRYRQRTGEFVDTTMDQSSAAQVVEGTPVREFRWYKGKRHYSGWYWSSTMGGLLAYESRLELARLLLADFDRDVVRIAAQPFQMIGHDGSRIRRHVPDLLLVHRDGRATVIDVKAPSRLETPVVRAMLSWAEGLIKARGWAFEVWSGADLGLLANTRMLAGYGRPELVATDLIPIVLEMAERQETIGGIEQALADEHPVVLIRPVILHLIWRGELEAALDEPLGRHTSLTVV